MSSNLALSAPVPALSEPVPAPVAAGGHVASAAVLAAASHTLVSRDFDDAMSFVVAPPDAPRYFGRFATDEPEVEPLSGFAETGPIQNEPDRTYFADYDEGPAVAPCVDVGRALRGDGYRGHRQHGVVVHAS